MKKIIKVIIIIAIVLVIGFLALLLIDYYMQNRPANISLIEMLDETVSYREENGQTTINSFNARVINKSSLAITKMIVKIDVYDKEKMLLDGSVIEISENIPPNSARLIKSGLNIDGLPLKGKDNWTWTYTIQKALSSAY